MLNCGGRVSCGCKQTKGSKEWSSASSYSSTSSLPTSTDEHDSQTMKGKKEKKLDVVKQNGVGAFLAALSPRNLLKGIRKHETFSMTKAERSKSLLITPKS